MGKMEKISAWNLTKVRSKKEVIDEARTTGAARGMGSRAQQAAADSRGSRTCACENTLFVQGGTAGGEG